MSPSPNKQLSYHPRSSCSRPAPAAPGRPWAPAPWPPPQRPRAGSGGRTGNQGESGGRGVRYVPNAKASAWYRLPRELGHASLHSMHYTRGVSGVRESALAGDKIDLSPGASRSPVAHLVADQVHGHRRRHHSQRPGQHHRPPVLQLVLPQVEQAQRAAVGSNQRGDGLGRSKLGTWQTAFTEVRISRKHGWWNQWWRECSVRPCAATSAATAWSVVSGTRGKQRNLGKCMAQQAAGW